MRAIVPYVLCAIKEYLGVYDHTKIHSFELNIQKLYQSYFCDIFDFLRQFIMSGPEMALFEHTKKTEST
jgi:hypothetical protein